MVCARRWATLATSLAPSSSRRRCSARTRSATTSTSRRTRCASCAASQPSHYHLEFSFDASTSCECWLLACIVTFARQLLCKRSLTPSLSPRRHHQNLLRRRRGRLCRRHRHLHAAKGRFRLAREKRKGPQPKVSRGDAARRIGVRREGAYVRGVGRPLPNHRLPRGFQRRVFVLRGEQIHRTVADDVCKHH